MRIFRRLNIYINFTKDKAKKGVGILKFENDFKEIKIKNIIIIYLITMVVLVGVVVFMVSNYNIEFKDSNMNFLCLLAGILVLSMLIYAIKPSKQKLGILLKDFRAKLNIKEVVFTTLFLLCLNIGGAKIIINIIYLISPSLANAFINDKTLTINSMTDYYICFIILVILSPIIDELTFRYVIFKRLTQKFNIYVGLIVSTIIFSAINICPEIIGTLALGIINCILYVKYENILIPMFMYFANNIFYMLILVPLGEFKKKIVSFTLHDIMVNSILGIVLFIIGAVFMIKFIISNKVYIREHFYKSNNI